MVSLFVRFVIIVVIAVFLVADIVSFLSNMNDATGPDLLLSH